MWAGVDVGGRRKGFHVALLDKHGLVAPPVQIRAAKDVANFLSPRKPRVIAVDCPRSAAPDGSRSRECERALAQAVCGIRYTPERALLEANGYYAWILNGFELYEFLIAGGLEAVECFPTASFTRWFGRRGSKTRAAWSLTTLSALGFRGVRGGQDGRDAVAAALTARAYDIGSFESFGEIVVPLPGSGDQNSRRLPSGS
jgi:predicted nuclease with RNAse H fold